MGVHKTRRCNVKILLCCYYCDRVTMTYTTGIYTKIAVNVYGRQLQVPVRVCIYKSALDVLPNQSSSFSRTFRSHEVSDRQNIIPICSIYFDFVYLSVYHTLTQHHGHITRGNDLIYIFILY